MRNLVKLVEPGIFPPYPAVPLAKGKPHPNCRTGGPPNVSVLPNRAQLIPVVDRGETYSPPELHKGALLKGQSAATVAELAIAYLRSMIAAAAKLTPPNLASGRGNHAGSSSPMADDLCNAGGHRVASRAGCGR
jgi:hypothetical protein